MTNEPRAGRPRASSRETLADAACELFLERGFENTSIADIASRAGVSRSSFFNYFASKSDVLWAGLDERLTAFERDVRETSASEPVSSVERAVAELATGFTPDPLALAIVNAAAMGLVDELAREGAVRRARVARAVVDRLQKDGADRLAAEVAGAAWGGAVLSAIEAWALDGAGRTSLRSFLQRASTIAARTTPVTPPGAVRQLRLVVHAPEFDRTLAFYRDAVGMPQVGAYEADGGARVAILEAGRATLELANFAQISFIDRVETDGGQSDRLRVALEVDDARSTAARLSERGAEVEASARPTPWGSINARLRGPADLQLTLFQELGSEDGDAPGA
ncbi:TetR family transcriptional regulator [Microbacterium sp. SLBN-146]|uniref:TetR family transcriptional regulator n=1 Tax=Microbacterium sp. SLBN-146 TaxID=2768457 RepID=UPI001150E80F|nr:TetR family transcriptional regulator [Microbacterium sp. SLBN-146]